MRETIHKALAWAPGAVGGVAAFACIWETPREWIGERFADLVSLMANPLVTVFITLLIVAYATAWYMTGKPTPIAVDPAKEAKIEAEREKRVLQRQIIKDAREMVPKYELQVRWTWREYLRYTEPYAKVRPHISRAYKKRLNALRTIEVQGGMEDPLVAGFLDELDRLEKKWGLI